MKKIKTDKNIYKTIRGYKSNRDTSDVSLREVAEQKIEEACSILRSLNINTLPELLVEAQLQKVEYRWYRSDFRTRSLWKNIYMSVSAIGENNVEHEESFVQNHEVGSKDYHLYKVKK